MGVRKLPYPPVKPNAIVTIKAELKMTTTGSFQYAEEEAEAFYVERNAWVQDAEGKKVESKGQVIIFHDVCVEAKKLAGFVFVNEIKYGIALGKRLKNPDGTVHHVELELI